MAVAGFSVPLTDAPSSHSISSYYGSKLEELEGVIREKTQNLARLSAQRNALNTRGKAGAFKVPILLGDPPTLYALRRMAVRQLREELQLLQEPGSYVGEVVKAMGKAKVLVKCGQEGKYVSEIDKVLLAVRGHLRRGAWQPLPCFCLAGHRHKPVHARHTSSATQRLVPGASHSAHQG